MENLDALWQNVKGSESELRPQQKSTAKTTMRSSSKLKMMHTQFLKCALKSELENYYPETVLRVPDLNYVRLATYWWPVLAMFCADLNRSCAWKSVCIHCLFVHITNVNMFMFRACFFFLISAFNQHFFC